MSEIEKIREGLYVKKSLGSYRVIYPLRNEDGSRNWFNILTGGSYWNLVKVILIVSIILLMVWSYQRDIRVCTEFVNNIIADPIAFCLNITITQEPTGYLMPDINFTKEPFKIGE